MDAKALEVAQRLVDTRPRALRWLQLIWKNKTNKHIHTQNQQTPLRERSTIIICWIYIMTGDILKNICYITCTTSSTRPSPCQGVSILPSCLLLRSRPANSLHPFNLSVKTVELSINTSSTHHHHQHHHHHNNHHHHCHHQHLSYQRHSIEYFRLHTANQQSKQGSVNWEEWLFKSIKVFKDDKLSFHALPSAVASSELSILKHWNLQVERVKVWDNLIINLDFAEGRNCASAAYFWASYTWLMAAILQSHTLCQMMIAAHSPNLWPKNGRRGNTYKLCFADWDILQTIFNLFWPTQFLIHFMLWSVTWNFLIGIANWSNIAIWDGGGTTYLRMECNLNISERY